MVFTRCDRCGAMIEEEKKKSLFERITDALTHKTTYSIMKQRGGEGHLIDLCDSCQEELRKFLNPEKKLTGTEIRATYLDENICIKEEEK